VGTACEQEWKWKGFRHGFRHAHKHTHTHAPSAHTTPSPPSPHTHTGALVIQGNIDPGIAGLALVYALDLTRFLKHGTNMASKAEADFNSVVGGGPRLLST